jgi:7-carboxy-7-deazaguanine synthase
MVHTPTINVNEMFYSIQGEGTRAGLPCIFVRLQGCKLRCVWCDTPYALDHRVTGLALTLEDIVRYAQEKHCTFIEFTGGEPLEHEHVFEMLTQLCDLGYTVAIETGGHVAVDAVDPRVIIIMDVKCPDSKMSTLNKLGNLEKLALKDEVKFVIASRADYEFARSIIRTYNLEQRVGAVLMSCVFSTLQFVDLVNWILEDHLHVRFQLQMHKFVWSPETRGV